MTTASYLRGHRILSADGTIWRYADDGPVVEGAERPCVRCGRPPVGDVGADACLGVLPGVKAACCGHGVLSPYVLFEDGTRLHPGDVEVYLAIMSRREA